VHVTAKDLGTGKEQSIKIVASQKLEEGEIERMRGDAEKYAEEDKKRKKEIETINEADALAYSAEKTLREFGEKIGKEKQEKIQKRIEELKSLLEPKQKDVNKIKQRVDELKKRQEKTWWMRIMK